MTIPNNNPTRSAANAHEGQAAADTNKRRKYEVDLHFTQYKYATIIVEADSPEEAEEKAETISWEADQWKIANQDLYVYSVEPVSEGKSHE